MGTKKGREGVKTLKERIQFMQEGGQVVRFHQHIGHRLDTDARHSHGVAMLCYFLTAGAPTVTLLMAALSHDLAEQVTGDIPYPTKRRIPALRRAVDDLEREVLTAYGLRFEILPMEQRILSLADSLDGMLYCASEAALGNRTALQHVYHVWYNSLAASAPFNTTEQEVINAVHCIWEESNDPQGSKYAVGITS